MKAGIFALLTAIAFEASTGWAATLFDGSWRVTQNCGPAGQDVHGYTWTYTATVRNGVFSGEHRPASAQDGSGRISGRSVLMAQQHSSPVAQRKGVE